MAKKDRVTIKFIGGPKDGCEHQLKDHIIPEDGDIHQHYVGTKSDNIHQYAFERSKLLWRYIGISDCDGRGM